MTRHNISQFLGPLIIILLDAVFEFAYTVLEETDNVVDTKTTYRSWSFLFGSSSPLGDIIDLILTFGLQSLLFDEKHE